MNKIKERVIYWLQIFLLPIYGLSFLMPRDKNIWLFGSTFGNRFTDNPRYLYLHINDIVYNKVNDTESILIRNGNSGNSSKENDKNYKTISLKPNENNYLIRPIWISHNKEIVEWLSDNGYEAYYYHSLKGIWYALRAGVYIYDNYSKDINFWQSGGAIKVNLWHGSGNKRINHDNEFDKVRHPKNAWEKWCTWLRRLSDEKPTDYVIATSSIMADYFSMAFKIPMNHVIVNSYPRNDALFDKNEWSKSLITNEEKALIKRIEDWKKDNKIVAIYMPTFRQSETKFFDIMDMKGFDDYLKENNYIFLCKLHPKSKIKEMFAANQYENIVNVSTDIDCYTVLGLADMLITDYSSVYTDYMLLNRPVIAFDYDEKDYITDSRGYFIKQDEYMPEIKAYDMEGLMTSMKDVLNNDCCKEKRLLSRERMFDKIDGDASRQLVEDILIISRRA